MVDGRNGPSIKLRLVSPRKGRKNGLKKQRKASLTPGGLGEKQLFLSPLVDLDFLCRKRFPRACHFFLLDYRYSVIKRTD